MTTARKAVLIVATVLLVGGSALALGAFAAADFRFENLSNDTRDWASTTLTLDAESETPHTAIVVSDRDEGVRFEPADGDAIEVVYWTSSEKAVDVVDEGGTLAITGRGTSLAGFQFMKVGFQDHATVVKVPRSYTGSLTVETSSGSIDVADLDGLGSVALSANSGYVSAMRVSAGSVDLKTSSGNIVAVGVEAEAFSARASSGSLSFDDVEASSFEARTSSGDQSLGDVRANTLSARSSSGDIETAVIDAEGVELEASSGSIHALFAGTAADYDTSASSSSGHVSAPNGTTGAAKRIVASTTSGSIDLRFMRDGTALDGSEGVDRDAPGRPLRTPSAGCPGGTGRTQGPCSLVRAADHASRPAAPSGPAGCTRPAPVTPLAPRPPARRGTPRRSGRARGAHAGDVQELVVGGGALSAHVAQGGIGEHDVGRHAGLVGQALAQRAQALEQLRVDLSRRGRRARGAERAAGARPGTPHAVGLAHDLLHGEREALPRRLAGARAEAHRGVRSLGYDEVAPGGQKLDNLLDLGGGGIHRVVAGRLVRCRSSTFALFDPRSTSTTSPLPKRPRSSCTQRMTARAVSVTSTASNVPSQLEQLLQPSAGVPTPPAGSSSAT